MEEMNKENKPMQEQEGTEEILNKKTDPAEVQEENKEKGASGKHKHKKEDQSDNHALEIAAWNDKYLRLFSEYDNYRKRTLKEKIELSKTASAEVIIALLPALDDFERAIKAAEDSGESGAHVEGLTLIYNKLKSILTQQGLEPIKAMGEVFDTDFHEAITEIPAPTPDLKGKVVDVIQQGYTLGGKVIRYAKVVVGTHKA